MRNTLAAWRSRHRSPGAEKTSADERGLLSHHERSGGIGRAVSRVVITTTFVLLSIVSVGPLLWMVKGSLSSAAEVRSSPLAAPDVLRWSNYTTAWNQIGIAQFTVNSLIITGGIVVLSVLLSAMLAFVLSVLRPRFGPVIEFAVLATLFIPGVISLVPLYLTVIEIGLLDSYWALWLPAGANALNVLLILQHLRGIPPELFEAARIDGAGPLRIFVSIALPLSKPVLGAVALLSFAASWKDYLWPLLALPSTARQPLSVALSRLAPTTDQAVLMAGMVIAVAIPLLIFLVFQRQVLNGAGASGAIKG